MHFTFLGTGTSTGVPTIGCHCRVCESSDPRDKRTRCSALIESDNTRILIDCGPDFRQQIIHREFKKIDAVLLTHIHYDHVTGLDDLRPFAQLGDIEVYANEGTIEGLHHSVPYFFAEHLYPGVPKMNFHVAEPYKTIMIGDIPVMPLVVYHDKLPIYGYRFGDNFAYITDMRTIDEESEKHLQGIKTLVVNALRFSPEHHSHQSVAQAIEFIRRIGAQHTYLIHSCHHIGLHAEVNKMLPHDIEMAYDGMEIDVF